MNNEFKQNKTQLILYGILFALFFMSTSPLIVLTSFLIICGFGISTFVNISNQEHEKVKSKDKRTSAQVITVLLLQIITLASIGLIVWIFLSKKIEIFKPLLS